MLINKKQLENEAITLYNDYQKSLNRNGNRPICAGPPQGGCANLHTSPREECALSPKNMYPYMGRQVPGQIIDFDPAPEPWGIYKLADGSEIRAKLVLLGVVRLDEFNEQGDPIYQFQFQQIIGVNVPDALKRKAQ